MSASADGQMDGHGCLGQVLCLNSVIQQVAETFPRVSWVGAVTGTHCFGFPKPKVRGQLKGTCSVIVPLSNWTPRLICSGFQMGTSDCQPTGTYTEDQVHTKVAGQGTEQEAAGRAWLVPPWK